MIALDTTTIILTDRSNVLHALQLPPSTVATLQAAAREVYLHGFGEIIGSFSEGDSWGLTYAVVTAQTQTNIDSEHAAAVWALDPTGIAEFHVITLDSEDGSSLVVSVSMSPLIWDRLQAADTETYPQD